MAEQEPTISTHVLDVERGQPAAGIEVVLLAVESGSERPVGRGTTDQDGRITRLLQGPLLAGLYRIEYRVDGPFFRSMAVWFQVEDVSRSYHVPLVMAPYSLATYRGS